MDYDSTNIAAVYDSGRSYDPEILQRWLDLFSTHVSKDEVSRIVDLGCGTGRYSESLAVHFEADVVGIDPSEKMLAEARRKTVHRGVVFEQASGDKLPIEDTSADMVLMSMVFHHLPEPRSIASECFRVLREGGSVCLRNSTVDAIETYSYLKFFPSVRSMIEEQLPTRDRIGSTFEGAGFQTLAHEIVKHQNSPNWADYAEKLSRRSDSFLMRISDDEFNAGIAALRSYAQSVDAAGPLVQDIDFFVFQR